MVGGLGGLDESGVRVDQAFNEADALLDGFNGDVVLLNLTLVLCLSKLALTRGSVPGLLGLVDESMVTRKCVFVVLSCWVEPVEEVHVGNTDPRRRVHDTPVDFLIHGVMGSKVDLVVFLLGLDLEPEVTDDLLERCHELINWPIRGNLKLVEPHSDLSPSGGLDCLDLCLHEHLLLSLGVGLGGEGADDNESDTEENGGFHL